MQEQEMFPAEQLIESVDRVISQLRWTPWAFRLEEDGTLVSDPDCNYFKEEYEEEEDWEVYERKMQYQQRMWEEYGELFSLNPFSFEWFDKVKGLDWLDISSMTWAELMENFLSEELPLVRAVLRTDGFWHKPVPGHISDNALNQMIAFRYKERLVQALLQVLEEEDAEEVEEEEDLL